MAITPSLEATKTYLQVEGVASNNVYINQLMDKAYSDIIARVDTTLLETEDEQYVIPENLYQPFYRLVSHYFHNSDATSIPYIDLGRYRKWSF